jgi:hypothetical protein
MPNFDPYTEVPKLKKKTTFLPRLDKIRLGVKKLTADKKRDYPAEVDYFVLPERLVPILGDKPKEIQIMFPPCDRSKIFPYAYKYYGSSQGLKCIGNGITAMERQEDRTWLEGKTCTCERLGKGCNLRGHLQFWVAEEGLGGVYQIDTSSEISITEINSNLDYVQNLVGRFHFIPLLLRRVPTETHFEGKKQTHYTLQLECPCSLAELPLMRANPDRVFKFTPERRIEALDTRIREAQYELPAPEDINPAFDKGAKIEFLPEKDPGEPMKASDIPKAPVPPPPPEITLKPLEAEEPEVANPTNNPDHTPEELQTEKESKEQQAEKEPTSTVDVTVNEKLTWITKKAFGELEDAEKIKLLREFFRGLNVEQPTPAPLEDHTTNELKTLYRWLYQERCPMAKKGR